jgi:hypothetical protein
MFNNDLPVEGFDPGPTAEEWAEHLQYLSENPPPDLTDEEINQLYQEHVARELYESGENPNAA